MGNVVVGLARCLLSPSHEELIISPESKKAALTGSWSFEDTLPFRQLNQKRGSPPVTIP